MTSYPGGRGRFPGFAFDLLSPPQMTRPGVSHDPKEQNRTMLIDSEIESVRSQFPIFHHKIYVNNCSQGALSGAVEAGLQEYAASWHQQGSPWELWTEQYEAVRASFARMIGAKPGEVAVVTSASAGINSVASALCFTQRKNVVMGEFEFPTMGHVWLAQRPRGAGVHFLEAVANNLPVESYERAVDRHTLIVPLTHVCFMNGFRSDVQAIARIAHAAGALVMLDDYQDCGTRPIDVKALDVDFYVTGTLKYLLAAPGLAFLYVREELIQSLTPTISGWFAQTNPFAFNTRVFDPAPNARRFEAGTPPIPSIYAALRAFDFLEKVGLENAATQVGKLTRALMEGTRSLKIKTKTPPDSVGPLVVLQAKDANAMVAKLAERNIVSSCRHDGVRVSFQVYNTLEDVRAVLEGLEQNLQLMVLDQGNN